MLQPDFTACKSKSRIGSHTKITSRLALPADLALMHLSGNAVKSELSLSASTFWAKYVLIMDDLGLLIPTDWTTADGNAAHIGMTAIKRWVHQQTQGINLIRVQLQILGDACDDLHDDMGNAMAERKLNSDVEHVAFALIGTNVKVAYLEEHIQRLDSLCPGLGHAVLTEISLSGWRSSPVFAPIDMLHQASYLYWQGDDDESTILDELRHQGMSDDEIANENILTKAELLKGIPSYVTEIKEIDTHLLLQWRNHEDPWVRGVVITMARLKVLRKSGFHFFPADGIESEIISSCLILRWNTSDHVIRVFDDVANYWYQGDGYTDLIGLEFAELSKQSIKRCFQHFEKGFRLIRELDHLISIVSSVEDD